MLCRCVVLATAAPRTSSPGQDIEFNVGVPISRSHRILRDSGPVEDKPRGRAGSEVRVSADENQNLREAAVYETIIVGTRWQKKIVREAFDES